MYLQCRYKEKSMRTRVQRWGNSLALRIPSALAEETDLHEGTEVEVAARQGKLVITRPTHRFRLSDLLAGITNDNIHAEVSSGGPRGKEVW
jgi:antitoxin MazE